MKIIKQENGLFKVIINEKLFYTETYQEAVEIGFMLGGLK